MPYLGSNSNAELQAGMTPTPTTGHVNPFSHTLNDTAGSADQGLADTSERWDASSASVAATPQSVLAPLAFSRNASPNGTSGSNFVPGVGSLGSDNAESDQTFNANLREKYAGGDPALP
jgi:hypothetical protein